MRHFSKNKILARSVFFLQPYAGGPFKAKMRGGGILVDLIDNARQKILVGIACIHSANDYPCFP